MINTRITLREGVRFHGHLGPYLVLGLMLGNLALSKLKAKKYFGVRVIVKGAAEKPKSCLIDGIQVSTGCTYGKGNIHKAGGNKIEVLFNSLESNKKLKLSLKKSLLKDLINLKGRRNSEIFAKKLPRINPENLFEWERV